MLARVQRVPTGRYLWSMATICFLVYYAIMTFPSATVGGGGGERKKGRRKVRQLSRGPWCGAEARKQTVDCENVNHDTALSSHAI
jgi:hypothetical protein